MSTIELPATRPTLADVARAANVSIATASRVLNGFPGVRAETRTQVESAMTALGYARQRAVRSASSVRTRSIALVVCEGVLRLFADPYFARVVSGASRELSTAGMQLVLVAAPSTEDDQNSVVRYLGDGHADGALVVSMHSDRPLDLDWLDIPLVFGGRPSRAGTPNRHT